MTSLFTNLNREKWICIGAVVFLLLCLLYTTTTYAPYQPYRELGPKAGMVSLGASPLSIAFPDGAKTPVIARDPFKTMTETIAHQPAVLPSPVALDCRYDLPALEPATDIHRSDLLLRQWLRTRQEAAITAAQMEQDGVFWKPRNALYASPAPESGGGMKKQELDILLLTDGRQFEGMITAETTLHVTIQLYKDGKPYASEFPVAVSRIQSISRRKSVKEIYQDRSNAIPTGAAGAPARLELALLCLKSNLISEAIAELNAAIQADPAFEPAYMKLGEVYLTHTRSLNDALLTFQRAMDSGLDSPRIRLAIGRLYFQFYSKELIHLAIEAFEKSAEAPETREASYSMLGRAYLAKGDVHKARDAFAKLSALKGGSFLLDQGNGMVALQEGRLDDAVTAFGVALEKLTRESDALFRELQALNPDEVDPESLAKLHSLHEQSLEIDRQEAELLNCRAAAYYWHGSLRLAYQDLKEAITLDPANTGILVNLALLYSVTGRFDDARDILTAAEEILLGISGEIAYGRAVTLALEGIDSAEAERMFRVSGEMAHDLTRTQTLYLDLHAGLHRLRQPAPTESDLAAAVQSLKKTLEQDPDFLVVHPWMHTAYKALRDDDRAVSILKKAVSARPGDPVYLYLLGHEYTTQKDHARAKAQFEKVLERDPGNAFALCGLGYVEYQQGNSAGALHLFAEAVRQAPQDAPAATCRRLIEESLTRRIVPFDFDHTPSDPDVKDGWKEVEPSGASIDLVADETETLGRVVLANPQSGVDEIQLYRELEDEAIGRFVRLEADLSIATLPEGGQFGIAVGTGLNKEIRACQRIWINAAGAVSHFGARADKDKKTKNKTVIDTGLTVNPRKFTLAIERDQYTKHQYTIIVNGETIHTFQDAALNWDKSKKIILMIFAAAPDGETIEVAVEAARVIEQDGR